MPTFIKTYPKPFSFKGSMLATISAVALLHAYPAIAKTNKPSITNAVAKGARTCVTSHACSATPTSAAFGGAVRSMDRLGWEIGRGISIKKYGPAGDPGQYPGLDR